MGYRNLQQCVEDLERHGHLVRLEEEIDPYLEAAEIQRRVFAAGGPAVLFARVKDCRFPMVSNLFGTMERTRYIFRDTLTAVRRLIELKVDPAGGLKSPVQLIRAGWSAKNMLPRRCRDGPVLARAARIDQLPQLQSWPDDGGAFVTLPLVYTEHVDRPGLPGSNLGMYRVQISGGQYEPNEQIGLHYQIHRGIGVHHSAAVGQGKPFRVNIFVGGTPAMTVGAVMPLPEGLSELGFAGALAGHRIPMVVRDGRLPVYAEADFCITGTVDPERLLPEGPFGDHLGYYSLAHEFPVLRVESVHHRNDAIWPFTVVGRPPQEDTMFGQLIHELTGPVIPTVVPGVREVHAVDAAGVHPLMLAIGSERYTPYQKIQRPQEILTQASAILGQGQMSLAKYLMIVAKNDDPNLRVHNIEAFFQHLLCRVDWRRDLHFHTCTTIDTLDYSGSKLNEGSKVVMAAVGPPSRELPREISTDIELPDGYRDPRVCLPGVMAVQSPSLLGQATPQSHSLRTFCDAHGSRDAINRFPLVVLVDDAEFTAENLNNFLWVTFTRSNPATDVDGIEAFVENKHWGCGGALVVDARRKPHHAPPLVTDETVSKRVDALAARQGPLARWL